MIIIETEDSFFVKNNYNHYSIYRNNINNENGCHYQINFIIIQDYFSSKILELINFTYLKHIFIKNKEDVKILDNLYLSFSEININTCNCIVDIRRNVSDKLFLEFKNFLIKDDTDKISNLIKYNNYIIFYNIVNPTKPSDNIKKIIKI